MENINHIQNSLSELNDIINRIRLRCQNFQEPKKNIKSQNTAQIISLKKNEDIGLKIETLREDIKKRYNIEGTSQAQIFNIMDYKNVG